MVHRRQEGGAELRREVEGVVAERGGVDVYGAVETHVAVVVAGRRTRVSALGVGVDGRVAVVGYGAQCAGFAERGWSRTGPACRAGRGVERWIGGACGGGARRIIEASGMRPWCITAAVAVFGIEYGGFAAH